MTENPKLDTEDLVKGINATYDGKSRSDLLTIDKNPEVPEFKEYMRHSKVEIKRLINNCEKTIKKIKNVITNHPDLFYKFLKKELETAITKSTLALEQAEVSKGFSSEKIRPKKIDPLNEVWDHFFA